MTKGLAAAPKKNSTLRMDGPIHPRSCRHTPVSSVRPSPLLNLPRCAPPVHASAFAASHHSVMELEMVQGQPSRVYKETSYAGGTGSSFEKLHSRLPMVCRVQDP